MKLKIISQITLALVLLAASLTIIVTVASYLPILLEHPHWKTMLTAPASLAHTLLQTAGLTVFLAVFIKRINNPDIRITTAFPIACILILLATLSAAGLGTLHIREMFRHMPRMDFLLHITTSGIGFASGLCMSFFILTRAINKPLAALTVAAQIALFAINGIRFLNSLWNWSSDSPWRTVAWLTHYAAYGIHTTAILLFLITFLATPKPNTTTETLTT